MPKPRWTKEETRLLKKHYHNTSNLELSKIIARTPQEIALKAFRLKIEKSKRYMSNMGRRNVCVRWGK